MLDCAHGATYRSGPEIFRRLGASVTVLAGAPDGRNINDGCGSTHTEAIVAAMRDGDHDIGFAFDGDGDRLLAVDRNGSLVDGDELIALATLHLRAQERLPGGGVVVTVMTNYGFHTAMAAAGIEVATTASATATCSRSCARAAGASAASSPGTSSTWASSPRVTGSPPRC